MMREAVIKIEPDVMSGPGEVAIEQYQRDGFLVVDDFLPLPLVKQALTRVESIFNGQFETGVLPDKVKWQKGRVGKDTDSRAMANVWKSDRAIARLTLHEKVGLYAAKLMGWRGTRANQDNLFWVPPHTGNTAYHQDEPYQDWHTPGRIVTCWIALADVAANGGALEYARGSQLWPMGSRIDQFHSVADFRSNLFKAVDELQVPLDPDDIVVVPLKAGSAVFHDGRLWHGSDVNRSDKARFAVSTHCMSIESQFHPNIVSPMFNHYKRFGDLSMDESFFPVLWSENNSRSAFLAEYVDESTIRSVP